jgi:endonuclease-3
MASNPFLKFAFNSKPSAQPKEKRPHVALAYEHMQEEFSKNPKQEENCRKIIKTEASDNCSATSIQPEAWGSTGVAGRVEGVAGRVEAVKEKKIASATGEASSTAHAVWETLKRTRNERKTATVEAFHEYLLYLKKGHSCFACLMAALMSVQTLDTTAMQAMKSFVEQAGEDITARLVADMDIEEVEVVVKRTNFYKTKAKNLQAIAKALVANGGDGQVPRRYQALVAFPGIGPKIAHLFLSLYLPPQQQSGICVDVHVNRVSARLRWTPEGSTPEGTRKMLQSKFERHEWEELTIVLIGFGQEVCLAKTPKCHACVLSNSCPSVVRVGRAPAGGGPCKKARRGAPKPKAIQAAPPDSSPPWPGRRTKGGGAAGF